MTLTLSVLLAWIIIGFVIGGLARLLVPGRQRIGMVLTMLIGVVAAIVAGVITTAIVGAGHPVVAFVVALVAAALLVSGFSTHGYAHYRRGGRKTRSRRFRW